MGRGPKAFSHSTPSPWGLNMPIDPIDPRFAHITDANGIPWQVLKVDENGEPYDWDEPATAALIAAHEAQQG